MKAFQKRAMALSVAAIACGAATTTLAESGNDFAIEEIIVTAQKRAESVQDVAASISAIGGSQLDDLGITDTESLMQAVPGMHFSQAGSNSRITVRGIGSEQTTVTGDPGVAFHIDGVYQTRASAGSALFYDLDRVEVLRGPQGTLYGRNATGGSVNLISKRPTQDFEGNVELQVGDYDHQRIRGVVNAPLIDDVLAMRISGQQEKRDGYYENLTPGADDLEDRDALNLRTQFLYTPTETLDVLLSFNYSTDKGAGDGSKPLGSYDGTQIVNRFYTGTLLPNFLNALTAGPATANPSDPWEVRTSGVEDRDNDRKGTAITVDWDLGNVALKSISAWQKNTVDVVSDNDLSDTDIAIENRFQETEQYSQELQLSSVDAGDWEWVTGLYWLHEENNVDFWLNDEGKGLSILPTVPTVDVGLANPAFFGNKSTVEATSFGVFGQASYHINEEVKVTGGLRYSKDEKEADITRKEFTDSALTSFKKKDDWSSVTWKLGVDWQVTEDSLLYATVSTGFKSGGFLQSDDPSYDEETVLAWEIGSKNRFFDNRLQANFSAFYYEYEDMQLRTLIGTETIVSNAGEAEIKGLEAELLARPIDGLTLSAALAWTNAEFVDYFADDPHDALGETNIDLSGNDLARSPDFTINLNASYAWDLPWGTLTSSINYYRADEVYFSAFNRKDRDHQGAYHKTDVHLRFDSLDEVWYAALSVQNLENAEVASNMALSNPTQGGVDSAQWQAPQTVRFSLGYNF